jgi:hypothetical protein
MTRRIWVMGIVAAAVLAVVVLAYFFMMDDNHQEEPCIFTKAELDVGSEFRAQREGNKGAVADDVVQQARAILLSRKPHKLLVREFLGAPDPAGMGTPSSPDQGIAEPWRYTVGWSKCLILEFNKNGDVITATALGVTRTERSDVDIALSIEPKTPVVGMRMYLVYTVTNRSEKSLKWPLDWDGKRYSVTLTDGKGLTRSMTLPGSAPPHIESAKDVPPGKSISDYMEVSHLLEDMAAGKIKARLAVNSNGIYRDASRDKYGQPGVPFDAACWKGQGTGQTQFDLQGPGTSKADLAILRKFCGKDKPDYNFHYRLCEWAEHEDEAETLERLAEHSAYGPMIYNYLSAACRDRLPKRERKTLQAADRYVAILEKSDCRIHRDFAALRKCFNQRYSDDKKGARQTLDSLAKRAGVLETVRSHALIYLRMWKSFDNPAPPDPQPAKPLHFGFPSYPPVADADPKRREKRKFRVPIRLLTCRTRNRIAVSVDTRILEEIELDVGYKMVAAFGDELFVLIDGKRKRLRQGLGGGSDIGTSFLSRKLDGVPIDGKKYVIEVKFVIFETNIPPQHMWSPQVSVL